jgi:16S rRNA (adenine1518-N6/adenine1519-N6)-dimethyltransferase
MMTLSDMKLLLAEHNILLTKSLGQNFMFDRNQLQKIVAAAELASGDKVLEIGPGLGPLTELLLESAGTVLAIEKDRRLVPILSQRLTTPALRLVQDDALDYLRREARDWTAWKMVSNLPYSVASPILVELALGAFPPKRIVATLQIEVARRLLAKAGDPDYGVLSLLVQLSYEPVGSFKIPGTCFFPEPEVGSACVSLLRRAGFALSADERQAFVKIVKRAFSQRRKMMLKLLKQDWPPAALDQGFRAAQIAPDARAETVSREQFICLAQSLKGDSAHA